MSRMSLIEETYPKKVRMANLCIVASHAVNGVAQIHSDLLKATIFRDFNEYYPGKIQNKTNGVTPRRWIHACNKRLSALITDQLGEDEWIKNLDLLRDLEPVANDDEF